MWNKNRAQNEKKKRHVYLSVTKAIAGLQIRALLQLLGCLLMIDLTVCIFKLLGGQLSVFGLRNHCHRNRHEILQKNVDQPSSNFCPSPKLKNFSFGGNKGAFWGV